MIYMDPALQFRNLLKETSRILENELSRGPANQYSSNLLITLFANVHSAEKKRTLYFLRNPGKL